MDAPTYYPSRAHLLVCTGPRCSRVGGRRVFDAGWAELERRGLAYYKRGGSVRLTEAGCLGQCAHGPTMVAYHARDDGGLDASWYVGVDAAQVVDVAAALHEGRPAPARGRFGPTTPGGT